jgi:predicted transcriptional regulator of viral defense system
MKYTEMFRRHFRDAPAFTARDAGVFLSQSGISRGYLRTLLRNLVKKGELKRISKGAYTFREEAAVAGFAFQPFYYGLEEALTLRKLWEQETNPVIMTPRRVRSGVRAFLGTNIIVRRISRRMFFGFSMVRHYGMWLPVSDVEKTLIDFFHFREHLPGAALAEIRKQMRKDVLEGYLKRCPKRLAAKVRNALKRKM